MRTPAIVAFALLLAASPADAQDSGPATGVKNVTPEAAEKALAENKEIVVLDVRTEEEFKAGHLANAKNIDYQSSDFARSIDALDKTKTYLVHCAAGGRSTKALKIFGEQKFQSILHLDGGFKAWQAAGKPVEK